MARSAKKIEYAPAEQIGVICHDCRDLCPLFFAQPERRKH